ASTLPAPSAFTALIRSRSGPGSAAPAPEEGMRSKPRSRGHVLGRRRPEIMGTSQSLGKGAAHVLLFGGLDPPSWVKPMKKQSEGTARSSEARSTRRTVRSEEKTMRRLLRALPLLALLLPAQPASAACCYFAAKDKDILQPAQKAFITWNAEEKVE